MTTRALWQGRTLALLGIVLVAFSLRSAVASLSPVIDHVQRDFPVSPLIIGLIGAAPPVCYAIFGLLTPLFERKFGLVGVALGAIAVMTIGLVVRGLSTSSLMLLITTMLIFAGIGAGNIIVPPLVKKYFPDRLGLMMTLYAVTMSVSTFLPPLLAVPVADGLGWRTSLSLWAVFAMAAFVPWILLWVKERTVAATPAAPAPKVKAHSDDLDDAIDISDPVSLSTGPIAIAPPSSRVFGRLWSLQTPWALAAVFSVSATMAYALFAWMPTMLADLAGVDAASAGLLLSLFALVSLPISLVVPVAIVRFNATRALLFSGVTTGFLGLAGLLFFPGGPVVLWVIILGMCAVMFPVSLVLLSIRARNGETAVALSGFVQSVGYAIAAIFPPLMGVLHDVSGGWQVPLIVLMAVLVLVAPACYLAGRDQTVEDEWERSRGRW